MEPKAPDDGIPTFFSTVPTASNLISSFCVSSVAIMPTKSLDCSW